HGREAVAQCARWQVAHEPAGAPPGAGGQRGCARPVAQRQRGTVPIVVQRQVEARRRHPPVGGVDHGEGEGDGRLGHQIEPLGQERHQAVRIRVPGRCERVGRRVEGHDAPSLPCSRWPHGRTRWAAGRRAMAASDDDQASTPDDPDAGAAARPARGRLHRRAWVRGGSALAVAAVVAGVVAWREAPPSPEGLVILYGDSLSTEAAGAFTDELDRTTEAEVVTRLTPGASPCDLAGTMRDDLALAPDVVVIQFVGNTMSPCLAEDGAAPTGRALAERMAADVGAAATMFAEAGTRVVLVG